MNSERRIARRKFSQGIDTALFYGSSSHCFCKDTPTAILPLELCPKFTRLFGPSTLWKVFRKQHEVIEFVSNNNCDLLPFTYQINDGTRLFLAAHPITFWYIDEQRDPEQRHSYEIIQKDRACKLYFDLEFEIPTNPDHDGLEMVSTFINLVCTALHNKYNISCRASDVLNLDSSSASKFSCHLIFPSAIFCDNFHAGRFVKQLCYEIMSVTRESPNLCLLKEVDTFEQMRELLVSDSKGNRKLFCDEAVYSKNRHFRLYKSSKFGKNVILKVSERNLFEVTGNDPASKEENLFLNSLITYCDGSTTKLTYDDDPFVIAESRPICWSPTCVIASPMAEIDKSVNDIVSPGKIYKSYFLPEKRIIIYDIVGNRYCGNIGRPHKSNNVKYIVDVNSLTYYQKCYDPDCAEFRSARRPLPVDESVFINHNIDDDLVLAAADRCQLTAQYSSDQAHRESYSSSEDEDLIAVAERCELINTSRGKSLILQNVDDSISDENRSSYQNFPSDDDFIVSATADCEWSVASRKRRRVEETSEQPECDANERGKQKLMNLAIFSDTDDDKSIVAATEMCEKLLSSSDLNVS